MSPQEGSVAPPEDQCATTFIATVIALGSIITLNAAVYWTGQPLVASYIVLAAVASIMKVRLPGIPGTFSANCLVTVMAIGQLSAGELVFVSVACALVQSWWQAARRPSSVQVLFNAGVFAVSGAISGWTYGALLSLLPSIPELVSLVISACVFFITNTGLVSIAVALAEHRSPLKVWRVWHVWSLPYYLINVALAVLVLWLASTSALLVTAAAIPLLLLSFAGYRWVLRHFALYAPLK